MALSYEFSIGSVRARENTMFSEADAEQMLALKSADELIRFLKDKGYGEGDTIDDILESNTRRMWKYIRSIAPDFNIFEPFLIQNDVHNFKTVLKGTMSDRDYEHLLMEPCTIKNEELIRAVENRRFEIFPEWLREPADKAYQRLAETKDARLSDAGIDRAVLERLIFLGKKSGSVFLNEYFSTLVFYANVKTALRGAKAGVSRYFYEKALCECDGFDKQAVIKAALTGESNLVKLFEKSDAYDCRKAMSIFAESPSGFEKFVDDQLIRLAKRLCKLSSEGCEPLMGYYIGCEYERKLIVIIAGGIKTGTPTEKIRERLREIYG